MKKIFSFLAAAPFAAVLVLATTTPIQSQSGDYHSYAKSCDGGCCATVENTTCRGPWAHDAVEQ